MSQDRRNKRECPHCSAPLSQQDNARLQSVIDRSTASGALAIDNTPHELSCGHKASMEAASFTDGDGFWLVPR